MEFDKYFVGKKKENSRKWVLKAQETEKDIWDVTEGIPLGSGFMAHKDKEKNEIYILDEKGNEVRRYPNVFINDLAGIIELFRILLGLPVNEAESKTEVGAKQIDLSSNKLDKKTTSEENKEEEIEELDEVEIEDKLEEDEDEDEDEEELDEVEIEDELDEEEEEKEKEKKEEEEEKEEEDEEEEELKKQMKDMLEKDINNEEENGKEESEESEKKENEENVKKLAELKRQIDEKRDKVEEILTYMIENDKLVSKKDIQEKVIAGENPIFAKSRAMEDKIKVKRKILMAADDDMLETLLEEIKNNNEEKTNNLFSELFVK
jgi:flagellar biosynthesis GTPase FlhF